MTSPPKLILFDLDGTLLLTGGAGLRAMARAAGELFGDAFRWDGINPSGGLDPLLFYEAARRSGLSPALEDHAGFRERYIACLAEELETRDADVRRMPGVRELLEDLHERDDVVLGILTGNYAPSARLKLDSAKIPHQWFRIGVYGDEAPSRPALVLLALERARALVPEPVEPRDVIVVGDTPRDIDCARANGCVAFGVATGRYSVRDLLDAGAHAAVQDLSDPTPFLRWIEGM